jgi:hypothetical protein
VKGFHGLKHFMTQLAGTIEPVAMFDFELRKEAAKATEPKALHLFFQN